MAHLNSFVRIPALTLRQWLRPLPRIGPLDEDSVRMRVWPNDIDFNFHMNNSRYLISMDYGRIHWLAATGILSLAVRERWKPLVGSVFVTYRRSLTLWAGFELTSRTLCWDERWLYMEQRFVTSEGLAAIAWVKALLRDRDRNVPPAEILARLGFSGDSPPMTEELAQWNAITRSKLAG